MGDSLKDQLIKAGLKPGPRPASRDKKVRRKPKPAKRAASRPADGGGISLARAYEAREKEEQRRELERKRAKQREDALRREQNAKLDELLQGRALNDPEAEIVRHFQDRDRITRLYVTERQRDALANGELGIVKLRRRYLLVDADTLAEAVRVKPDCAVDLGREVDPEDAGSG